jgi:hypothetical protein
MSCQVNEIGPPYLESLSVAPLLHPRQTLPIPNSYDPYFKALKDKAET